MQPHGDHHKSCFTQDFCISGQPHMRFKGILNKPPEESRWGATPAWLLNVPHGTLLPLFEYRLVQLISQPDRRFLLADFRKLDNHGLSFRAYEANLMLEWVIRTTEVNPVTLQEEDTGKVTIENIPVYITEDFRNINADRNPNLNFLIVTASPVKPTDTLRGYKVNQMYQQDGLYLLKAERIIADV